MFLGIYFSCDVSGDPVPDTLAPNHSGLFQLLFVLFEVVGEICALLGHKFVSNGFDIGWLDSHERFLLKFITLNAVRADNDIVRNVGRALTVQKEERLFFAGTFPEYHIRDPVFAAGCNVPVHGVYTLVF